MSDTTKAKTYRIMYRPLHKLVDTIFTIQAVSIDAMLRLLPVKAHTANVEHLYVHEHQPDGTVVEVISYTRKKREADEPQTKPRIKLVNPPAPAYKLSGVVAQQGHYTAHEVTHA